MHVFTCKAQRGFLLLGMPSGLVERSAHRLIGFGAELERLGHAGAPSWPLPHRHQLPDTCDGKFRPLIPTRRNFREL